MSTAYLSAPSSWEGDSVSSRRLSPGNTSPSPRPRHSTLVRCCSAMKRCKVGRPGAAGIIKSIAKQGGKHDAAPCEVPASLFLNREEIRPADQLMDGTDPLLRIDQALGTRR